MINNNDNSQSFMHSLPSPTDLELLSTLLEAEDNSYPWNPADENSEEYFCEVEKQFVMQDVLEEEITERSRSFYNRLDNLWSQNFNTSYYKCKTKSSVVINLKESLLSAFSANVPQEWLEKIALEATNTFKSRESLGEQLVKCVQAVLPEWAAEDLNVMARPYAFAMRDGETPSTKSALKSLNERKWSALSEVEQARVSLMVAYQALQELQDSESPE
ncbi:hypothetical protein [Mastigocoleus testarum]|uniref:Uncharacterized protein n=1 Tax=Mastigocoleus testarum BC008 TaxID=371196 RepID=A0A0V7ZBY9_9CYAN|nr:hypothetical protein [Mastigocoleus testarum]KST62010.1 hypothetical protein BC008_08225 [Mastigocoleus testarum BC008]